jgi:hypothetical protein
MDQEELLAHIEREEAACIVHFTSLLSEQRRKAMQYYYGQPYGNEVDGRSQVVTTEVKDAVEGILPSLMAMFTASDEIVRFEAQKPDDEEAASQATDYVNYVFSRLNNGFLALYCLFKDALLQKNGYVKVYWENYEDQGKEEYEDLSDAEFEHLLNEEDLELKAHTEKPDVEGAKQLAMQVQQAQAQGMQVPPIPEPKLHDAVFKRSRKYGKVCIDPLPPEEVLISREAPNDLTKARFVEHRTLRSLSEIREMGYKIDDDIADYAPNADFNLERVERLKFDDALSYRQDVDTQDSANKRVWLCEAYLKVDYDGDGITELRKVTKVGKTILDNEEFDGLPIIGGTAILMPHKHYGLSLHDLVGDIQLQKSTVLRQLFDNAYVANNGRMEVLENMVNMSDLLTARPNGVVRVKAMGSVKRIDNPLLGAPFYNLLEYLDKVKTNRVGATDFPNAVDPDAINAKATFVEAFRNAALERLTLMARILAETCVKDIMWKILELESKHQQKKLTVKLRGKWVEVDPREWRNRFNMTVTVGLGTGSQQNAVQGVTMLGQIMQGITQMGLAGRVVDENNVYHLSHIAAKALFPREADQLFTDPKTLPPPQPQPNPDMLKLQLQAHKQEMQDKQKQDKLGFDAAMAQQDRQLQAALAHFKAQVDAVKQYRDHQNDIQKTAVDAAQGERTKVVETLTDLKLAERQALNEHSQVMLQGAFDSVLQQMKQQHEQFMQHQDHQMEQVKLLAEAAMAERELVRDEKTGKAKGTRVKRTVN